MFTSEITFRTELSEISRMNLWLAEVAAKTRQSKKVSQAIKLSLNEAVTNVISYGFDKPGMGEICVRLGVDGSITQVLLLDNGFPFDPTRAPDPEKIQDIETAQIGGFGVSLIREAASQMSYERRAGKNRLALEFTST